MALSLGLGLAALHTSCAKNDSAYTDPAPAISSLRVSQTNSFVGDPLSNVEIATGGSAWQVLVGSGGSPFDAAVVDAKNAPTDRAYAYANVRIFQSGKVQIDAYGFSETFGPTQLVKSIVLAH